MMMAGRREDGKRAQWINAFCVRRGRLWNQGAKGAVPSKLVSLSVAKMDASIVNATVRLRRAMAGSGGWALLELLENLESWKWRPSYGVWPFLVLRNFSVGLRQSVAWRVLGEWGQTGSGFGRFEATPCATAKVLEPLGAVPGAIWIEVELVNRDFDAIIQERNQVEFSAKICTLNLYKHQSALDRPDCPERCSQMRG